MLLAAPAAAGAVDVTADVRVEAAGKVLAPGYGHVTRAGTTTTDTSSGCDGSGRAATFTGPTPLGALTSAAAVHPAVKPARVSDKFSFGLLVCGVGDFRSSDSAFWLYKVNHVSPEVGGEAFPVKANDEVLWYFQDTAAGQNVGDELALEAPARARPGEPVDVSVYAYSFAGRRSPAAGATVLARGGATTTASADGRATVTFRDEGYTWVRAGRGGDIPSGLVRVCVARELDRCASVRGKRLFGTEAADSVLGTAGRDVVRVLDGNDVVDVRGGERDRVSCGGGSDLVRADRSDRVAADCERVRRAG